MNLRPAIEQFVQFLSSERNAAPRTVQAYRYDLVRLADFLDKGSGGRPVRLDGLDAYRLKDYIAHLKEEHSLRPTTLSRVISSMRSFFEFAHERGLCEANPAASLHTPKKPRKLPVFLTPPEAREIVRHEEEEDDLGSRNRTLILLLVMTGMRLSELVGLDLDDVDFERQTLKVMGKGRKERLVPINSSVEGALRGWLAERGSGRDGCRALFIDRKGDRLTPRMVQYAVRKAVKALGLDPRVSPHKLRHTFATSLYGEDVALRDIQELLGHASIASTSIYTHTNVERVRAAVSKLKVK